MATVETLQKRIEGKKKEIEKLNKKIARIVKAKESNWENNPYYYNENDLKWATKDLDNAQAALEKYEADLQSAEEKAASRDVKIIIDFIEDWKRRVREFYLPDIEAYYKEYAEVRELGKKVEEFHWGTDEYNKAYEEYTKAREDLYNKVYGYFRELTKDEIAELRKKHFYERKVKVREGEWEHIDRYISRGSEEDAKAYLEKELKDEGERKYDFIIERTNAIVGQITDASDLRIDQRGDLNGIIIGTKGKASVKTIGAGGYNQDVVNPETGRRGQIFHFRTLIKPVKE